MTDCTRITRSAGALSTPVLPADTAPVTTPTTRGTRSAGALPLKSTLRRSTPSHLLSDTNATDDSLFPVSKTVQFNTYSPHVPDNSFQWKAVGQMSINDVTDAQLTEFCIGEAVILQFPANCWHGKWRNDDTKYIGEVFASRCRKGAYSVRVQVL